MTEQEEEQSRNVLASNILIFDLLASLCIDRFCASHSILSCKFAHKLCIMIESARFPLVLSLSYNMLNIDHVVKLERIEIDGRSLEIDCIR